MLRRVKIILAIVGIVLVLIILGIIALGLFTKSMLDVVYVSLIIVALFTLVVTALQIWAIAALLGTISAVDKEMKPLLASVQETVGVVKDTARSAGQTAAAIGTAARLTNNFAIAPTVRAVSLLVAVQQVIRVFVGRGHARSRADQRRKQQMEAEATAAVGGE